MTTGAYASGMEMFRLMVVLVDMFFVFALALRKLPRARLTQTGLKLSAKLQIKNDICKRFLIF